MLHLRNPNELLNFIDKPLFVNSELEKPISLTGAVENSFSDANLNKVYKLTQPSE